MFNYKLTIAYDGTRYNGWQKQGNTDKTIQGKLEAVLERYTGHTVEVHGAGRTDAGVHAKGQTANFKLDENIDCDEMHRYFDEYLPEDICVLGIERVPERFHARLTATKKHYRYCICNNSGHMDIFSRRFELYVKEPLDVGKMAEAAKYFAGEHDFSSFCSNKHMKKSKVRTIYSVTISRDADKIIIDYEGDGFLYNMVRIMTGTLIEVGMGQRVPEDIPEIIRKKDRQAAGFTAQAQGLFLMEVFYE